MPGGEIIGERGARDTLPHGGDNLASAGRNNIDAELNGTSLLKTLAIPVAQATSLFAVAWSATLS